MPLTWAEQLEKKYSKRFKEAYQKGRQQVRQETVRCLRRLVLRQLEYRFGPISEAARQKIESIESPKRLTSIAERVLIVPSLSKLRLR